MRICMTFFIYSIDVHSSHTAGYTSKSIARRIRYFGNDVPGSSHIIEQYDMG